MKVHWTLAFAASAAALFIATAAHAQALFLPDGTYDFALKQGSTTVATSTVTVKRSGSVVGIHEAESVQDPTIGQVTISADESVTAEALSPLSFSGDYTASGKTTNVKLTIGPNYTGAFYANGSRLSVPVRLLPESTAMMVQDQTLVLSFLCLPGLTQSVKATTLTQAVPTAGSIHLMRVDPAPQVKPSGVPAPDTGVGVASPVAFSVWFDPKTGVVDEIDVPSQSLTILLTKH